MGESMRASLQRERMRVTRRALLTAAAVLPFGALPARAEIRYEDTNTGLRLLASDLLTSTRNGMVAEQAELIRSLMLPNSAAWFTRVFGEEAGARAAAEYARYVVQLGPALMQILPKLVAEERTTIDVLRAEHGDTKAMPLELHAALDAMRDGERQALYAVRYRKADSQAGQTFHSFAHVDGTFRLLGKMQALKAA